MARRRDTRKDVIETFIIDWPVLIFIGLLFGGFAPERDPWRSRSFMIGAVVALVFTGTAFGSYLVAPDWMWMYFVEPDTVAWSLPLLAIGYVFTFLLGFAAALGIRGLGRGGLIAAAVGSLIGEVVVIAMTWDRYRVVGTAAQWSTGDAFPLFGTPPEGPVRVISVFGPVFAVALAAGVWVAWKGNRAAAADR